MHYDVIFIFCKFYFTVHNTYTRLVISLAYWIQRKCDGLDVWKQTGRRSRRSLRHSGNRGTVVGIGTRLHEGQLKNRDLISGRRKMIYFFLKI